MTSVAPPLDNIFHMFPGCLYDELPPLSVETKKKKFRFADEDGEKLEKVEFFDDPRSENICPKFYLSPMEGEVPPYWQTGGSQWCDVTLDRKIYETNTLLNKIDPAVEDDKALALCKKGGIMKNRQVRESRIRNWHMMGPDPLRFLTGHILIAPTAAADISKVSPQVQVQIKKMLTQMIEDLETGKKEFICFYEVGSRAAAGQVGILKKRLKMFP